MTETFIKSYLPNEVTNLTKPNSLTRNLRQEKSSKMNFQVSKQIQDIPIGSNELWEKHYHYAAELTPNALGISLAVQDDDTRRYFTSEGVYVVEDYEGIITNADGTEDYRHLTAVGYREYHDFEKKEKPLKRASYFTLASDILRTFSKRFFFKPIIFESHPTDEQLILNYQELQSSIN